MTDEIRYGSERAGLVRVGDVLVPESINTTQASEPDAPTVNARVEVRAGRPELVQLSVTASADGRGIKLRDLERVFTVDGMIDALYTEMAVRPDPKPEQAREQTDDERAEQQAQRKRTSDAVRQQRARRRPDRRAELERVAEVYREHIEHQPTNAVAMRLGYTHRTAARRVQQAREAGLLPPTTPGKRKA